MAKTIRFDAKYGKDKGDQAARREAGRDRRTRRDWRAEAIAAGTPAEVRDFHLAAAR